MKSDSFVVVLITSVEQYHLFVQLDEDLRGNQVIPREITQGSLILAADFIVLPLQWSFLGSLLSGRIAWEYRIGPSLDRLLRWA